MVRFHRLETLEFGAVLPEELLEGAAGEVRATSWIMCWSGMASTKVPSRSKTHV